MPNSQKTTKGVREAPTASQDIGNVIDEGIKLFVKKRKLQGAAEELDDRGERISKSRYTVELTTEGWQIKDNERGVLLIDVLPDRLTAENKAVRWSREHANPRKAMEGRL